jgi:collagenase-like PrtC family protease
LSPDVTAEKRFYVGYSGRPAELRRLLSCGVPIAAVYAGGLVGKMPNAHRQYVESLDLLAEQVRMCHDVGVQIEILLDAPCFGGQHLWVRGQPLFIEYLRQLEQVATDGVIVSDPVIIELTKQHTGLRVAVSHVACVDSVFRAQFYECLGADAIILDPALNRQHTRLQQVVEGLARAEPRLLLNEGCFVECPYRPFQWNLASHPDKPVAGDYYLLNCTALRLERPSLLLKSPTIRPEDLLNYNDLTVHYCLAPRSQRREVSQSRVLQAYAQGCYDGDLLDLLADRGYPIIRNLSIPNRLLQGAWSAKWRDCLSAGSCGGCGFCDDLLTRALAPTTDD